MYYDVVEVKYIGGHKLEVTFENDKRGTVDLQSYIKEGGLFVNFSDIEYFKKVYVNKELGVLCWPNGLDIAPETLYSKATGEPLPDWVSSERNEHQQERIEKAS